MLATSSTRILNPRLMTWRGLSGMPYHVERVPPRPLGRQRAARAAPVRVMVERRPHCHLTLGALLLAGGSLRTSTRIDIKA